MSSIDDRIVQMQFDNDQFEKGVAQTNDSLDSLKDHLQLDGATKGFAGIQGAADSMNLGSVAEGVSRISDAFSTLGIIGINVLSRITQGAISLGAATVNAVVAPLIEGGRSRAIAIEQAKFQFAGLGLDITATMAAATKAVHDTAFTLNDAATAAAQLGASEITVGHGLEGTLAGIAGVAAQTGSSFSDIANIFEGIAGNTRVYGNDLLSLASRGVNATAVLAKAFGVPQAAIHDMVSNGEISFQQFADAMNAAFGANALKSNDTFTGALANMKAGLSRIGADIFTPLDEAERKVFLAMKSRIDDVHAAIQPVLDLVGQLEQKLSLKIVNFLEGINFGPLAKAAPIIGEALQSIYYSATGIAEAIGKGFRQIFPPLTYDQVINIANAFKTFVNLLAPGSKEFEQIQQTAAGFFAVLDIAYRIVSGLFKVIFDLFGAVNTGDGSFLSLTASIGGFLVKVDNAIKHGTALNDFFRGLENVLKVPIAVLKLFAEGVEFVVAALEALVTQKSVDDFSDDVNSRFSGLIKVGQFFEKVWQGIKDIVNALVVALGPTFIALQRFGEDLGDKMFGALKNLKFTDVLQAINTGLFGAVLLSVSGFFGNLRSIIKGNEFAFLNPLKLILSQLRINLKAFEMNLNAKTLLEIAKAIALIAASAVALSLVNTPKLALALNAMTLMMGELLGAFAVINKIQVSGGLFKMAAVTSALILLGVALDVLTISVLILSRLDWNQLAKGLTGVIVLIAALVGAAKVLSKSAPQSIAGGAAMVLMAVGIRILAGAVTNLAELSWADMAKGIVGVTLVMGLLVAMTKTMGNPLRLLPTAVAILALAGALKILSGVVATFAGLSWEELAKGLGGLVAALVAVGVALRLMPKNLLVSGAGLTLVAGAIHVLASSIKILSAIPLGDLGAGIIGMAGALAVLVIALNSMDGTITGAAALVIASLAIAVVSNSMKEFTKFSWDDIGRALTLLGATLAIFAVALTLMGDPLVLLGAASLIIAAVALGIMAPALKLLSTFSWDDIGRGLTVLAAGIVILALGGILLSPAIPAFIGLGIALGLMGVGILFAGVGIGVLAAGLALLGKAGPSAVDALVPAIKAFLSESKDMAISFGDFIGTLAAQISTKGPELTQAFTTVLGSMIDSGITLLPKIVDLIVAIIAALIGALAVLIPDLVNAGITILTAILQGINDNIELITSLALDIIGNFIEGIADGIPTVVQSGVDLVVSFINSIADAIGSPANQKAVDSAILSLAESIVSGLTGGLISKASISKVVSGVAKLVANIPATIRKLLGIASPSKVTTELGEFTAQGFVNGITNVGGAASKAAGDMGDQAVNAVQKSISDISDAVNTNIDSQPTIAPVLDLSAIKRDAAQINGLLGTPSLSVDNLKVNSASASAGFEQNMRVQTDADGQPVSGTQINYTQNNYSPKALSPIDVYRNTKSQLATAKGELDK